MCHLLGRRHFEGREEFNEPAQHAGDHRQGFHNNKKVIIMMKLSSRAVPEVVMTISCMSSDKNFDQMKTFRVDWW